MKQTIIILIALVVSGCAGADVIYTPKGIADLPVRRTPSDIEVVFDPPKSDIDYIGLLGVDYLRLGYRDPVLGDILPEMKEKAAAVGGDGILIRNQENSDLLRKIRISGEVYRYNGE